MPLEIREQVPLSDYTLYRIGGRARFFVEIKTSEELIEALRFSREKKLPFFVLGAGSNSLVSDRGYDGIVLHFGGGNIEISGSSLHADAGVMMAQAVTKSMQSGLSGFEWAIGIPGTVGGSVRGNAGCFGGEMKDVVQAVRFVDAETLEERKLINHECGFAYRHSIFKGHPTWIVVSVIFSLSPGDPAAIQAKIKAISRERSQKQDIGTKSCGCIFKNVSWARKDIHKMELLGRFPVLAEFADRPNIPASFLIDRAGLKGARIGRVIISPKHANYFVNEGGATAEEVVMLIAMTKDRVRREFGITLEEEIQYIGF